MNKIYLLLLVFCIPFSSFTQNNSYSEPVGFVRLSISAENDKLVSVPFVPFDNSLNSIFKNQLTGENTEAAADRILKWDTSFQDYVTAFKADNTGDTEKNGKFFEDDTSWTATSLTLSPGEGFFIENNHSSAQNAFLFGKVVLDQSKDIMLSLGLNLFSYPYSSKISLNSTDLFDDGANGASSQEGAPDLILSGDLQTSYWLLDDENSSNNGKWHDENDLVANLTLAPGNAFWYNNKSAVPFQWSESRPYSTKWDNPGANAPEITDMALNSANNEMTLTISCTGDTGETLDIFFIDYASNESFDLDAKWNFSAASIASSSQTEITWTDSGETNQTSPVIARDDITVPYSRYYMVSRNDIDSDSDGISDGREVFIYKTHPNDSDTDDDGLSDGDEINTHSTDPLKWDSDDDGISDYIEVSAADTLAPSVPGDPTVACIGKSVIALTWPASTDNVQVEGYRIYRNSREIGKTSSTHFVDFNLTPGISCSYYVKAYDLSGNESGNSSSVSATPNQSTATKLYVDSVNGNDDNNGTTAVLAKRSIQAAIDAATTGDMIIVNEGTYDGDISLNGKDLVIIAEDGPEKTVIDCNPSPGTRGISISSVTAYKVIIEDFTIKSGSVSGVDGGGILISGASPVIEGCVIKDNSADNGGGIAITGSGAKPEIVDCTISGNSSSDEGGAVYFTNSAKPKIRNCVIKENTSSGKGAGIYGE